MKKYLKRFGIIFLIVFAVIGVKDGVLASAAVGDRLEKPEAGWRRIDDYDGWISYSEDIKLNFGDSSFYGSTNRYVQCYEINDTQYVKFSFSGTRIRLISPYLSWFATEKSSISIDDNINEKCSAYAKEISQGFRVFYEKLDLSEGNHNVIISIPVDKSTNPKRFWSLDAIDIDSNGNLGEYGKAPDIELSSVRLNKGIGFAYYVLEKKPDEGKLTNKDYIPFDEISYFNVQEYKVK